jgi:hypothetical protein
MPANRLDSPEFLNEEVQLLLGELAAFHATRDAELSAAKACARLDAFKEVRELLRNSGGNPDAVLLMLDELQSKEIH